jgi:hypothetical protein
VHNRTNRGTVPELASWKGSSICVASNYDLYLDFFLGRLLVLIGASDACADTYAFHQILADCIVLYYTILHSYRGKICSHSVGTQTLLDLLCAPDVEADCLQRLRICGSTYVLFHTCSLMICCSETDMHHRKYENSVVSCNGTKTVLPNNV